MRHTLPGTLHGNPQNILIAGGGDGGALKQALRFKSLHNVTQVEIDSVVSEVCKEYLPSVSNGSFLDKRTRLVYEDAYDFVSRDTCVYDVIVLDLTDPVPEGPAARLFKEPFMRLVSSRLAADGIVSLQCGALLLQEEEIREQLSNMKQVFHDVAFHHVVVPSYQLTGFGFIVASNSPIAELSEAEFAKRSNILRGNSSLLDYSTYCASKAVPPYMKARLFNEKNIG